MDARRRRVEEIRRSAAATAVPARKPAQRGGRSGQKRRAINDQIGARG